MLKFNISRVLKLRGIEKPYAYLRRRGFSQTTASNLAGNKIAGMKDYNIQRLCVLLRCEPNDLFEWTPEKNESVEGHPLAGLKRAETQTINFADALRKIPINKVEETIAGLK